MFRVRVLGYWGAYPEAGEATAGYLVETDHERVLIDCGSGVLSKLFLSQSVNDLTAVIVSHHHYDHAADLGVLYHRLLLARLMGERTNPLPIYAPDVSGRLRQDLENESLVDFHVVSERDVVEIGSGKGQGLKVEFYRTMHPAECYSLRMTYSDSAGDDQAIGLKTFAYSADSSMCDSLFKIAVDADLFLCEASMYEEQVADAERAGHCTSAQVGALAAAVGVKRLALTHFPHYGDLSVLRAQAERAFGQEVAMAASDAVWDID